VLDGVESETVSSSFLKNPVSPVPAGQPYSGKKKRNSLDLLGDFGMSVID